MAKGDRMAAEELLEKYYSDILKYCLWHTPNKNAAEDAVQETFLKTLRYLDRYHHRGQFKSFLYKVAANTCIDLYRRKSSQELLFDELPQEVIYDEQGFEESLDAQWLVEKVSMLSVELQEIILLRFMQQLTLREMGQILDLPLRTVQSRLRKALKQLKKQWKEEQNG